MKTALICGISGQDGAYLTRFLLSRGYRVFGTSRDAEVTSFSNLAKLGIREKVSLASATLSDFRSIIQVLSKIEPDEVYNLTGQSSVGLSFEQPVETLESISVGTLNLLEAVRFLAKSIRVYNAGSGECFGNTEGRGADENMAFRPRSPYAVAKSAAFWEVANYREAYGLFACSGILFNHESPLRAERFVTKKIVSAACRIAAGSRETLQLGDLSIRRDWGWAPEYVEAMWKMLQQDHPEDFVIATGECHSLEQFVDVTFSQLGLNWQNHVTIDKNLFRPLEIRVGHGNPKKANRKLEWEAKLKMKDVIEQMIASEAHNADASRAQNRD